MESSTAERSTERPPALDAKNVCEAFQITAENFPDEVAIRTKDDEFSCTWGEYAERVKALTAGLAALDVERGDTLAIMLTNRPEFHFVDSAAMHLGATPFSIYNTYSPEQIKHLAEDAGNRVIITEQAFVDRVLPVLKEVDTVEHVVVVDGDPPEGTMSLDELADRGSDDFDFDASWRAVQPEDVITLIYTSGTTGPPKGVQLMHDNLIGTVTAVDEVIQFPVGGKVVSYLPMAHIAERVVGHYLPMLCAFTVTCCPDAKQVMAYLPDVRPTWFFGVPRIWEKLKAGLEAMINNLPDEQKGPTKAAIELGLQKVKADQAGEELSPELKEKWEQAEEQVLSKSRAMLGLDELYACNVGAAPTPPEVIEFFHALGVPLSELWGMSETTGAGCINPPGAIKIGSIGKPVPSADIKLGEDGEILIKGPFIMKGYRNLPDKTKETFTEDGYLMTGDIGEIDEDGYVKIVDRKKELIINAAGKNMSPANIESKLKSAGPLIGQAIAIGDRRSYNTALVTLDPDAIPAFAKEQGIDDPSVEKLVEDPKVIEAIQAEVDKANDDLARVEQIKKFKILPAEWEPGGDELTPTMKLKRKPIAEKYAEEIEALYEK